MTNLFVVFLWILRSDGLITVTDPDGNQIQVAASSLQHVGGASIGSTNSGILKCVVVKKLLQSINTFLWTNCLSRGIYLSCHYDYYKMPTHDEWFK